MSCHHIKGHTIATKPAHTFILYMILRGLNYIFLFLSHSEAITIVMGQTPLTKEAHSTLPHIEKYGHLKIFHP